MSESMGAFICGITVGIVLTVAVRFAWSEIRREYEERIERRARVLASTKFAKFAGIQ
jgi:hypothetical protein